MTANKSFKVKMRLVAARKCNKPVPGWVRMKPGSTQQYNAKRRHWRRTKLKVHG